jgi:beta-galactosidase
MKNAFFAIFTLLIICSCDHSDPLRKQISLNGNWEITKTTSFSELPSRFTSKVPVPGLVDLAVPALDTNRNYDTGIYWHKTHFTIDEAYPELVKLKIGKVKYHAKVYLNNQYVGEQVYCFTPATFDVRKFLNPSGEPNELIIGVGTVNNIPDTVIWGRDSEKLTYIPGIYDDVKLILTGTPAIQNIQIVPMIGDEKVRIVANIEKNENIGKFRLSYLIRELKSGRVVAKGNASENDFTVPLPGCQFWSPESPFLYTLELSTGGDEEIVRFGMRSFSFDTKTGRAMLNGKPYFIRGTNVCIFRFFEDSDRAVLPWTADWVVNLHQKFKDMHWNSIRYCIGFPPERWYDIADSLGFLIQNEYPIWTGNRFQNIYPGVTSKHLANEYRAWLPEHWNHPSVVIWDAQNESVTNIIGEAIDMVRDIDLSNRPWDNGWSAPRAESDPIEAHPYPFSRYRREGVQPSENGPLFDLLSVAQFPGGDPNTRDRAEGQARYPNPIIINEYAWLWLNRDGSTTTLTDKVYDVAFGKGLTTEQRYYVYARHLGMLTEYWRAHRKCAGILHFCGLGYSRPEEPRGQTSDHFIDIKSLKYEPEFVKYVKPSFAPVGLMVNFWNNKVDAGTNTDIEVYAINDLDSTWTGTLTLTILQGDTEVSRQTKDISIPAFERVITNLPVDMPSAVGDYRLEAEITYKGERVKSIREYKVN